jgi:predicted homoserine dehydrogenase-like protein
MRAEDSLAQGALPIGLAHHVRLKRALAPGAVVRWADVEIADSDAVQVRREMEAAFSPVTHKRSA